MKQTAIQWLVKEVNSDCLNSTFIQKELIDKALEMEKDQIKEAYEQGDIQLVSSDKYYKETYAE